MNALLNATRRDSTGFQASLLLALLCLCLTVRAQVPPSVSEQDYLADVPIVLSVSRLPQRLDETPGALTILDRDFIRNSGARDVADLMRLVPGFQVSNSFESVAPLVSYHGAFSSYSNRLELLIDGRSAYSSYFIGSVGPGLETLALHDIERIEVLRGSNSASYGARAMLGVINIVTRDAVDTFGPSAAVTVGENGIRDAGASLGWGNAEQAYRLTADTRSDDGLAGANGHNQVKRVNFRSDMRSGIQDEVQFRLGAMNIDAGKGRLGNPDNPWRDFSFGSNYAQLDWRRSLDSDTDLAIKVSHSQETYSDDYPYALRNLCLGLNEPTRTVCLSVYSSNDIYTVRASGRASSDAVSLQYTWRQSPSLRAILGGEYRREGVQSAALYNTDAAFATVFTRLFGNLEWRAAPTILVNAGGLAEHDSVSGDTLAPRLMVSWHMRPGQTWRFGVSKAFRPPSTFENFAKVRYQWSGPGPFDTVVVEGPGNLRPEQLFAREIGYLGEFPGWRMSLDARAFREQLTDFVRQFGKGPTGYRNDEDFTIRGLEYQLKWKPWQGAQFIFNQAYTDLTSKRPGTAAAAPQLATSVNYVQSLPGQISLALTHAASRPWNYFGGNGFDAQSSSRTDLRLAKSLRWGARSGELALVVQNLGGPYADYIANFQFERRAFVTLRLDN